MSADDSSNANTLKGKVQAMITEVTNLKDSYYVNVKSIEGERHTKFILEGDITSLNNKMKCLEADYEMLSSKLAETTHKFEETVKSADESEKQRRILDHKKDIEDERLATLEKFIRETSDAAVESEKKCDEIIKKLAVTDSDSELAHQRYDIAEKKSKELQSEIKSIASKLKAMQSKLENADELENKYERTIDDLRARLRNMERRTNDSEALTKKLRIKISQVQEEISESEEHYKTLKRDATDSRGLIRAN